MIRAVAKGEEPELAAFLRAHLETSMFLLGNLQDHGLTGFHPHATTYYRVPEAGPIRAVFGRNRRGILMCQAPDMRREDAEAFAAQITGQPISGLVGEAAQGALLLDVMGLAPPHDIVEPLYRLDLADLQGGLPPGATVRATDARDRDLLERWFEDYVVETGLKVAGDPARTDAANRAEAALRPGPLRILVVDGRPVAMASLNAQADDHVQVGGVYCPRPWRNRGYGRAITYAVLDAARSSGARVSILFANNPAAARAYEALGFRRVGTFRICLMDRVEVAP